MKYNNTSFVISLDKKGRKTLIHLIELRTQNSEFYLT